MTSPDQTPAALPVPLPEPLAAWVRHLAIQKVLGASPNRDNRVLWSCSFPLPGMGNDVSVEVLPTLVLRVRNRVSGEVFMQTEPASFGPLAPNSKTLAERFEQWCAERRGETVPADAESAEARQAEEGGQS
ncbi:hypothetical protein [Hydrogenophaga pseudoflava]|uniref:hypothetical protein n=1 Tax=Hydrogenophaga pseudoflava TaxID=47421 RepID=UPI000AEB0BC6|nr:hypothetical protein [Hydrogenophaga pseudoflava]